jgi:3-deoxy-D-manno-octulosonic-acid transferase
MILAPRHLNRVEGVEKTLSDFHLQWVRSSELSKPTDPFDEVDVVLLDEFGRLEAAYGTADLALVGGGWSENGGHNPLEAAQYGVPVIVGPDMSNFRESTVFLRELEILVTAESRNELVEAVRNFLDGTGEDKQSDRSGKLQERIEPIKKHYLDALEASLGLAVGGNQK